MSPHVGESWMLETRENEFSLTEARWGNGRRDWLVLIPAGEFMMGAAPHDDADENEKPRCAVAIRRQFWLMKYPVTQEQYEKIVGVNPSMFKGDPSRPVENVSRYDAIAFIRKFKTMPSMLPRLPSEAEWEFACRAGTRTKYYWGDEMDGSRAWFNENTGVPGGAFPVGEKPPNEYGLHDMLGNVWEWVGNAWSDNPAGDPKNSRAGSPEDDRPQVVRGGSWTHSAWHARSSKRDRCLPGSRCNFIGLRLAMDFGQEQLREEI